MRIAIFTKSQMKEKKLTFCYLKKNKKIKKLFSPDLAEIMTVCIGENQQKIISHVFRYLGIRKNKHYPLCI